MNINFAEPSLPKEGTVAAAVLNDRKFSPSAEAIDKATDGALERAVKASRFKGSKGQTLELFAPGGGYERVILVGLGKPRDLKPTDFQDFGGAIVGVANKVGAASVTVMVDALSGAKAKPAEIAAQAAFGANLASYRFDKYRTKEKDEAKPTLESLTLMADGADTAMHEYGSDLEKVADGVRYTRDLVSEPANVMYPETLAAAGKALENLGVEVEILGRKEMEELGMGSLLGVGQGSERESKLLIMQWNGGKKDAAPIAFIGKGVTFDTGGISIKPAGGMEDMKWDMGGAGVVIGLMKALAGRKAKANVVCVAGLVENMPSGTAQRPGDVVTSMSGQTIEVINTDAEGRLVLADALWYTQDRFKPQFMVNLATLTGAIIIALGNEHAGLFANKDDLAARLLEAGKSEGEPLWRLPLGEAYDKQINSDIADMKNVGGREAGSITAAQFLQRFVNEVPWAHLDIAGTTWSKKDKPTVPKGGTGFGVRLLNRFVAAHYEK